MTETQLEAPTSPQHWLDKTVFPWWPAFSVEKLLLVVILVLTLFTRFYDLGARTMSHDEVNHVAPAYSFETYVYDPVTHGPFQFHALALSYFLLGDSDFSARVPAALFGIGVVVFALFAWKRYLGRVGALAAGLFFLISPYILFYSRYTRNEIFIVFWGSVMLWLFLRYLESGETKWLYWLTFITALHYTDKATSYIFTAEACIFLALLFVWELNKAKWKSNRAHSTFLTGVLLVGLAAMLALGFYTLSGSIASTHEAALALDPNAPAPAGINAILMGRIPLLLSAVLVLGAVVYTARIVIKDLGWQTIRASRSFDLIVLQMLLILPLLTSLVANILGFNPTDYTDTAVLIKNGVIFSLLALISVGLGLMWNKKVFLRSAALFWGVFIIFYTSFFTHGEGFFKGIVGALGYWMEQHGEVRGSQPLFYYALVQIPFYEFLPAIGTITAFIIAIKHRLFSALTALPFVSPSTLKTEALADEPLAEMEALDDATPTHLENAEVWAEQDSQVSAPALAEDSIEEVKLTLKEDLVEAVEGATDEEEKPAWFERFFTSPPENTMIASSLPTVSLLLYWSVMSLLAFSIAGERMPWLTTHITMPLILAAGWAVGWLVEKIDWAEIKRQNGFLVLLLCAVFFIAFGGLLGSLLGAQPPFQGKDLVNLQATSNFLLAAFGTLASAIALIFTSKRLSSPSFPRVLVLSGFLLLAVLTGRAAFRAAYINYDNAKEFLVYAHSTRDMKDALEQTERISRRLFGDKSIPVAYDADMQYPFWWYLRDYPRRVYFDGNSISKTLRDSPVILAGAANFAKLEPVVGEEYYQYNYIRMWWPIEDYKRITPSVLWNAARNPALRSALWQMWFNRDYTEYAAYTGSPSLTLATWSPSDLGRMYIRKDVAEKIWEYGLSPAPVEPKVDPYAGNTLSLDPVKVISIAGDIAFNGPRAMATAPDGSLYIADSRNHRIVHLDGTGLFLNAWGTYANVMDGAVPDGSFNEPWGVAVAPNGDVFVTDTWNHRVQVFSAEGTFLRQWNSFMVGDVLDGFWGPRGIAVSQDNKVFVTDTGKQRVVVFDVMGNYLGQFGSRGLALGQLDEPVGIAVNQDGLIFVADTWNNRVQVFKENMAGGFDSLYTWDVDAWNTDSLDNKPFLALNAQSEVFLTDPDRGRIIRFDGAGGFQQLWGGFDNSYTMGIISGVTVGADGLVWVSDSSNNTLLAFELPPVP